MWNHERRTVEWMLRGGETVVVFLAMSWALFWAATRWKRPILPSRRLRRGAQFGDVPPVALGADGSGEELIGCRKEAMPTARPPR
jgi:hypothetical protein